MVRYAARNYDAHGILPVTNAAALENGRAYRGAATLGTSFPARLSVYPENGEQVSAKMRTARKRLVQILPVMWRHHRPAQAAKERCMQTPTHAKIKI